MVLLHQFAYLVAHPDPLARAVAAEDHTYLDSLARVGLLVGTAVAVWVMTCRATNAVGYRVPPTRELAGAIGLVFLAQETLERLAQGGTLGEVVAEPAVWVGLALIPLLAVATRSVLVAGSRLRVPAGRALLAAPPPAHGWSVLLVASAPLRAGVAAPTRARPHPPLRTDRYPQSGWRLGRHPRREEHHAANPTDARGPGRAVLPGRRRPHRVR